MKELNHIGYTHFWISSEQWDQFRSVNLPAGVYTFKFTPIGNKKMGRIEVQRTAPFIESAKPILRKIMEVLSLSVNHVWAIKVGDKILYDTMSFHDDVTRDKRTASWWNEQSEAKLVRLRVVEEYKS